MAVNAQSAARREANAMRASVTPAPYRGSARKPSKLLTSQRGLEFFDRLLDVAPMRRDGLRALVDLQGLFAFAERFQNGRHPHERAEVPRLALERLSDVGHRSLIVVLEIARCRAR